MYACLRFAGNAIHHENEPEKKTNIRNVFPTHHTIEVKVCGMSERLKLDGFHGNTHHDFKLCHSSHLNYLSELKLVTVGKF